VLRREARTESPPSPSLPSGRPVVDEGDPLPKEKVETGAVVVVHGDDESRVEAPMLRPFSAMVPPSMIRGDQEQDAEIPALH